MSSLEPAVQRLALKLYRQLDTPRSLTCFLMLQYGAWDDLASLRVNPSSYEPFMHDGVTKLRRDSQATEYLRKFEDLPIKADLESEAIELFYATEKTNCETNLRLSAHIDQPVLTTKLMWAAEKKFARAKAWLARVLGPLPTTLDGKFGRGATFESKQWRLSKGITSYDKLQQCPSVTSGAKFLESHIVWETAFSHAWGATVRDRFIPITFGNRFITVPKDATKRRGICIEPGLNMLGQLAVGRHLKKRLKLFGLDLEIGQDVHQFLAMFASIDGFQATIDLSNASDTICYNLVRLLLPEEWFMLLVSLRCPKTYVDGRWVVLEKFSSMGNGFTFELETLLFAALIQACGGKIGLDSFVYGDDMIVPSSISRDVCALLRYCGLTTNDRKTFTSGYFRESCGGDFFNGHDVRPVYLEKNPNGPSDWMGIANGLWRSSRKLDLHCLVSVRNNALDSLPADIRRCRGPEALGDLVIHDEPEKWNFVIRSSIRHFRVWRPVTRKKMLYLVQRRKNRFCGPVRNFRPYISVSKRSHWYGSGVCHTAALIGLPSDGLSPRDSIDGYRFGRVAWS